jgi:hypothetical protein
MRTAEEEIGLNLIQFTSPESTLSHLRYHLHLDNSDRTLMAQTHYLGFSSRPQKKFTALEVRVRFLVSIIL